MNVLLFDVDGVLVADRAYRLGVIATLDYFGSLMGLRPPVIDEAAIETFHAHGYTNEWDICPFGVGVMLIEALTRLPDARLTAASPIGLAAQLKTDYFDRMPFVRYLDRSDHVQGTPSARAAAVLLPAADQLILRDDARAVVQAALRDLLTDPYDIARTETTQVFQEHVLGSAAYEETYHLRPRFDLPSLLYTADRPLLNADHRRRLDDWTQADRARICVYTARPSLPPSDSYASLVHRPAGFSPEAELAVQLVDLPDYPLIAMGRMQWLAQQTDQRVEALTKPAPVQALAAIGAAMSRQEAASLMSAFQLASRRTLIEPLAALRGEAPDVWVIEDATLGLQAARGAIELLRAVGIQARLHGIGVSAGGPKTEALKPFCETLVPDVNAAIDYLTRAIDA